MFNAFSGEIPVPPEDRTIHAHYEGLQCSLGENGLPATVDRTQTPQRGYTENDVTITLLASPLDTMGILLEGSRSDTVRCSNCQTVPRQMHFDVCKQNECRSRAHFQCRPTTCWAKLI